MLAPFVFIIGATFAVSSLVSCGAAHDEQAPIERKTAPQEAWNSANDPRLMSTFYETAFEKLPRQGSVKQIPWGDSYWPSQRAGIAQRWADAALSGRDAQFTYVPPRKEEVLRMSRRELEVLSPAEKFDILQGRYDYPTVARERDRTQPTQERWEGLCHGWAPASIAFAEPRAVTLKNPDGVEVPFGSSDVKALLIYYAGHIAFDDAVAKSLADRCNADLKAKPETASLSQCRDTNPGAFHIVVANQIALMDRAFIIDVTRDAQVWNQPVHSFHSELVSIQGPSVGAAENVVQELVIETQITYTVEMAPRWDPVLGTPHHVDGTKRYRYTLELDADGRIIGGTWLDANYQPSYTSDRPDFLWTMEIPKFAGPYAKIQEIYEAATKPWWQWWR